jgi:hypothetical protein
MKILLDENLPHDFRHFFTGHEVFTVAYLGWEGTQNGALIRRAAADGFEVMVTRDVGITGQHNPESLPLAIVVLHAKSNSLADLVPLVPALLVALDGIQPCAILQVGR